MALSGREVQSSAMLVAVLGLVLVSNRKELEVIAREPGVEDCEPSLLASCCEQNSAGGPIGTGRSREGRLEGILFSRWTTSMVLPSHMVAGFANVKASREDPAS
jgi:hypothetical protein